VACACDAVTLSAALKPTNVSVAKLKRFFEIFMSIRSKKIVRELFLHITVGADLAALNTGERRQVVAYRSRT
jgi:hypothetical protein